tara:strand:+ start:2004 stop:2498 length:495 start_codon:yes stop_codon:yes gene_type:complete
MSYDVYSKKDVLSEGFDVKKNTSHRWSISSDRKSFIYFLCNKDHEIVYIGQSFYDPSVRVLTHEKEGKKEFLYYRAIQIFKCPIEELNNIEAELILKYKPFYNKVLPKNDKWASFENALKVVGLNKWDFSRLSKNSLFPKLKTKKFNNHTYYSIDQIKGLVIKK